MNKQKNIDKLIYDLNEISTNDVSLVGPKAAHLGDLLQAHLPVPTGVVLSVGFLEKFLSNNGLSSNITPEMILKAGFSDKLRTLLEMFFKKFANLNVAVRSSAIAEDLPNSSFAGMYETFLNVKGFEATLDAVKKCWASFFDPRVTIYTRKTENSMLPQMAVIIQNQVNASSAGVMFTINPVTGNPNEIKINSTKGLGEKLVSGEVTADEWTVTDSKIVSNFSHQKSLSHKQIKNLAKIGKQIEELYRKPQDIEWAYENQNLFIVQARPITSIPEFFDWTPPIVGGWMRHFRLGEWLGEPVTPLFQTWLLDRLDTRIFEDMDKATGVPSIKPYSLVVNGWYYAQGNFVPSSVPKLIWFGIRYMVPALLKHPRRVGIITTSKAYWSMKLYEKEWREKYKIEYEQKVKNYSKEIDTSDMSKLFEIIDDIANSAGDNFYSFITVGGSAWKPEAILAEFYKKHLQPSLGKSHQILLQGLGLPTNIATGHQVTNLDWNYPTIGEISINVSDEGKKEKIKKSVTDQKALETQSREVLKNNKKLLKRFDKLLTEARDAAKLREEQTAFITLGWPIMRKALIKIGDQLSQSSIIDISGDIFFLNYQELKLFSKSIQEHTSLQGKVIERKQLWKKQRLLSPPDIIGKLSPLLVKILSKYESILGSEVERNENNIYGMPASAGKISGIARIILSPNDFSLLQKGEILIAPMTGPAWTPLFSLASGVVTDTGSIMAHASLIAREYGIPAVVGTGNATKRIQTGNYVSVNGNTGEIIILKENNY